MAPILWCDNLSALALAYNLVFHARTMHIEVNYHFIREKVLNRDALLKFISTGDQIANIFTKRLSSTRFLFLKSKLMVRTSSISLHENVNMKIANAAFKAKASEQEISKVRSSARSIARSIVVTKSYSNRKARMQSSVRSIAGSVIVIKISSNRKARMRSSLGSVVVLISSSNRKAYMRSSARSVEF